MVRSIDLQQVFLQTKPVERIQQAQQHHSDAQQRYFEDQLVKESKKLQEQVKESQEDEQVRLKQEEQRKQERKAHGNRKSWRSGTSGESEDEVNDGAFEQTGGNIDIKV